MRRDKQLRAMNGTETTIRMKDNYFYPLEK